MANPHSQDTKTSDRFATAQRIIAVAALPVFLMPVFLTLLALPAARWWWPLELCTHFRWHYFLALAVGTVLFASLGWKKAALLFGILAIYDGLPIGWLLLPLRENTGAKRPLRLVIANVLRGNEDPRRFMKLIEETAPDVVLIMELTKDWRAMTTFLDGAYPHHVTRTRGDSFGIGLWCRREPKQIEIIEIGPADVPSVIAYFDDPETGQLHLVGTHPLPPVDAEYSALRNHQLAALAAFVADLRGPVIVAGDLNTTSWSPFFQDLITESKLRDSRAGFGNQASWPSFLGPFGIAIDHVLVSSEIGVKQRAVGPPIGSDHRPVIIDVVLPASNS